MQNQSLIPRHWLLAARRKAQKDCDIKRIKIAALAIGKNKQVLACEVNRRIDGNASKRSYHAEEFLIRILRKRRIASKLVSYIAILRVKELACYLIAPCSVCHGKINSYLDS